MGSVLPIIKPKLFWKYLVLTKYCTTFDKLQYTYIVMQREINSLVPLSNATLPHDSKYRFYETFQYGILIKLPSLILQSIHGFSL